MTDSLLKSRIAGYVFVFGVMLAFGAACSESSSKANAGASGKTETSDKPDKVESTFDAQSYTGPTFSLPLAKDGSIVKFTDFLGKGAPVVLNFWGTWCPPCRREMPEFVRVYADYKEKGVEIIGVALRENAPRVNDFTSRNGITWPQVIGTPQTAMDYGRITGVPTTIIYDSQGTELNRYVGPLSESMFRKLLDEALAHEATLAKS